RELRETAVKQAARYLGESPSKLVAGATGVAVSGEPDRHVSWKDLAAKAGGVLAGTGHANNPLGPLLDPKTGSQVGSIDFMVATHGCDLAIEIETGEVRVLRYAASHDIGYALNAAAAKGQIVGGITMGLGQIA